jgi:DeoR family transcriptional regulator of aga operon
MKQTVKRREEILAELISEGSVRVADLAERFGVSAVTIRQDLAKLEAEDVVRRSYGGAVFNPKRVPEQDIRLKDSLNVHAKDRIGAYAAQFVSQGDNIIVDSGTTTMTLARHIRDRHDVSVMTNGLNIVGELVGSTGLTVMMTGGKLRNESLSFQGAAAEASLDRYYFDKLFLGVDGCDFQFGLTTHDEAEADLNRKMIGRANRVFVLADSSKFGQVALHSISSLKSIHAVVTDGGIAHDFREKLELAGIDVFIAE